MNIKKRQEVINLMPWYNLSKLSADETKMVEHALAEDESLKDQLALDHDIMTKVIADPKLLDRSAFESSTVRLDKVMAQIDDSVVTKIEKKPTRVTREKKQSVDLFAGVKSFFANLISGSSHSFTYAVFAALAVVQLSLLMFYVVPSTTETRSEFGEASNGITKIELGSDPFQNMNGSGLVLIVTMKDNIKIEGLNSNRFGDLELELLPSDMGSYRVRLKNNLTPDEFEVLRNELLRKNADIKSIEAVF